MMLVALLISLVWLFGTAVVVAMCWSAAAGDRTEIVPSWDDLAPTTF